MEPGRLHHRSIIYKQGG